MMATTQRGAHPLAPLVLDDAGSLEAMAAAVMRLHSTLMTVGAAIRPTPQATGPRLSLDASSPCLRVHSVRYSVNRRPIASQTSLTRSPTWPSTWSRTTSLKTVINEPALSLRCPYQGSQALRSCCPTVPSPKTTSTTPGSRTSYPETVRPAGSPRSCAAVALRAWATRRTYRIKASARMSLS